MDKREPVRQVSVLGESDGSCCHDEADEAVGTAAFSISSAA